MMVGDPIRRRQTAALAAADCGKPSADHWLVSTLTGDASLYTLNPLPNVLVEAARSVGRRLPAPISFLEAVRESVGYPQMVSIGLDSDALADIARLGLIR